MIQNENQSVELIGSEFSGALRHIDGLGAAFEPLTHSSRPGQSLFGAGGLNFEHIFNGTRSDEKISWFTPRTDKHSIVQAGLSRAVVRHEAAHSTWRSDSSMTYILSDRAIDMEFQIRFREDRFPLGYVAMMWASYMHKTRDRSIHFIGETDGVPGWMSFGDGPEDDLETGTIAARGVPHLPCEEDAARLNVVESEAKRFVEPFYYGLLNEQENSNRGDALAYVMMFDAVQPIRFAMWNFVRNSAGDPDTHSPAWDWQYVVHAPQVDKWYGYRARCQCLRIADRNDVVEAYRNWRNDLDLLGEFHPTDETFQ